MLKWMLWSFVGITSCSCFPYQNKECVKSELDPNLKTITTKSNQTLQYFVRKIWGCDHYVHEKGETYVQITNFLHGYIANIRNINPDGKCLNECSAYTYARTENCLQNKWCNVQSPCSNIIKCSSIWNSVKVCLANMSTENRRYQFIEDSHIHKDCEEGSPFYVNARQTAFFRSFNECEYCFCICEEGPTPYSDIYISLRTAMANISDNRVVTGIRFVKHNRIIHFQVQDGKLMPNGKVDGKSLRWVPVEDYKITHRNVVEGRDYHKLTWKYRSIHLNDIMADKGHIITGAKFRLVGAKRRLHLAILTTPFDIEKGRLNHPFKKTFYKSSQDLSLINKFGKELKLKNPDIPTRGNWGKMILTKDKYVQFTHTDERKDGAQTTVPFFDARPVVAGKFLIGMGLYHKGAAKSGGFITPAIFTYEIKDSHFGNNLCQNDEYTHTCV